MFTLRMLGGISLTNEAGVEVDSLLRQPKHVALLAYLASPRPGTWHKRDSVLGTFWAEHDQAKARSAFRSALYTVRRHLPDNAIRSRGDNDLSVDQQLVATDTSAMAELFEKGDYAASLAYYKGEFLPGIYVTDAEGFEQWLERERRRTRDIACQAAKRLSEQLESRNDLHGAINAARRNYEIDPDDEGTARRLIALLDKAGDRSQAFAVYEEFRNHLYDAFGIRPSAETVALLDAVRTRHEPGLLPPPVTTSAPPVQQAATSATSPAPPRRLPRWLAFAAIPVAIALIAWTMWPTKNVPVTGNPVTGSPGRTMVVLPVANETGDASLDYLATGIGDDLARRLDDVGAFTIRSAARSQWPAARRTDLRQIIRTYGANFLLLTSLNRVGDSLHLSVSVIDGGTLNEDPVSSRSFSQSSISDLESRIAADVAGVVFQRPLPPAPAHTIDPESYRLTLQGLHQLLSVVQVKRGQTPAKPRETAQQLFQKAINIDPLNARAWAGLSSVWASMTVTDQIPFDQGYERVSSTALKAIALDSLQGTAFANLGVLEALKYGKVSAGEPLIRKAEAAEPSNPEVYLVKSVLYRNAHKWDEARDAIRVARKLAPMTAWYLDREAVLEFCAGRPAQALDLYRAEFALDPSDGLVQGGITRALAMMHRYDEALDSWRLDAKLQGDTALLRMLDGARGAAGYWGTYHVFGRQRLKAMQSNNGRISPVTRMQTSFAAGDSAAGFKALDELVDQGIKAKYRLTCMVDVDEFRDTPRFKAAVARAGSLTN